MVLRGRAGARGLGLGPVGGFAVIALKRVALVWRGLVGPVGSCGWCFCYVADLTLASPGQLSVDNPNPDTGCFPELPGAN